MTAAESSAKVPCMAEERPTDCRYLCPVCSHPVSVPPGEGGTLECSRCGHRDARFQPKSPLLTLIFSLTALIFYVPANVFPFMTIELYGNRNSTTIWGGILSLFESGSWAIALIVFLASMLIPLFKLAVLFYLSLTAGRRKNPRFKTSLYLFTEAVGRWSMLDIFLLAVLVAIMKLGPWTAVQPEVGSLMFALVVIFTMLASAKFDPRLLWETEK